MRVLLKMLLFAVVSAIVTRVAALVVSKQLEAGSEVSDEFRRVVIFDGLRFTSRAGGLRSGEISVLMGGATVDLRDAAIDPAGAGLLVENTMGGLKVIVRDDWAVTVEETSIGGSETQIDVTPSEALPEDAPRLRIDLINRMGGALITTDT